MEKELFGAIRDNYYSASDHIWSWNRHQNTLVKIIFFPWLIVASGTMKVLGVVFGLGVILDKISVWLQSKRDNVIASIENTTYALCTAKSAYFVTPIKAAILAPIALFLGVVPKWSSTLTVAVHPDFDVSHGIEHGYFTKTGKAYADLSKRLFQCSIKHGVAFSVLSIPLAMLTAPVALLISLVFFLLIVLDYIGWLVGIIRKFVVSSSNSFATASSKNAGNVVLMPLLLTVFVPVYVALLLIPKIATYDET